MIKLIVIQFYFEILFNKKIIFFFFLNRNLNTKIFRKEYVIKIQLKITNT